MTLKDLNKGQLVIALVESVGLLRWYADPATYERIGGVGVYKRPILNDRGEQAESLIKRVRSGDVAANKELEDALEEGRWYSRQEVEGLYGCSSTTVYKMRDSGELESRVNPDDGRAKQYRFPVEGEDELVAVEGPEIDELRRKAEHADQAVEELQKFEAFSDGPVTSTYDLKGAVHMAATSHEEAREFWNRIHNTAFFEGNDTLVDSANDMLRAISEIEKENDRLDQNIVDLQDEKGNALRRAEKAETDLEEARRRNAELRDELKAETERAQEFEREAHAKELRGDDWKDRYEVTVTELDRLQRLRLHQSDLQVEFMQRLHSIIEPACDVVASSAAGASPQTVDANALRLMASGLVNILRPGGPVYEDQPVNSKAADDEVDAA